MIDAAAVLQQADREAPIAYCTTCKQDTMPVRGLCLWCDCDVTTGLPDPSAVAAQLRARERERSRHNAAAYRSRRSKPATHQVAE